MSLLDVIGPVMVGPSSSHTAGACRLALLARSLLLQPIESVRFVLHGSFAKTAQGHGTDLALVGGILGMKPDDGRIRNAFEEAERAGLACEFVTEDLGDVHPNSVRIEMRSRDDAIHLTGSSLGAGLVKVFMINDLETNFSGSYNTLLVRHQDQLGVIANVSRVIADNGGNIATIYSMRSRRGGDALLALEVDKPLDQYVLDYLERVPYASWVRLLPVVMDSHTPASSILERNADAA